MRLQGNVRLTTELEALPKISGGSRAINSAEMVSVLDTTPEAFALYRELLKQLNKDRQTPWGSAYGLKSLGDTLQLNRGLSKQQIEYIKVSIANAVKELPEKPDASTEAVKKLGWAKS